MRHGRGGKKLAAGVRLLLLHPQVATRDCQHCLLVLYDEKTGEPVPSRIQGYRPRDRSCPPPCRDRRGCAKGTPEAPRSLSAANLQAYEHYLECQATGQFPNDPIVRQNAAIIRGIEEQVSERRRAEFRQLLVTIVTAGRR